MVERGENKVLDVVFLGPLFVVAPCENRWEIHTEPHLTASGRRAIWIYPDGIFFKGRDTRVFIGDYQKKGAITSTPERGNVV